MRITFSGVSPWAKVEDELDNEAVLLKPQPASQNLRDSGVQVVRFASPFGMELGGMRLRVTLCAKETLESKTNEGSLLKL